MIRENLHCKMCKAEPRLVEDRDAARRLSGDRIQVSSINTFECKYIKKMTKLYQTHPRFVVVCVRPVSMKLNYVWMFKLGEIFKDELYVLLLGFEVFPFGKLHLVPHHLHTFLGVHREVGAVYSRYVPLFHLKRARRIK